MFIKSIERLEETIDAETAALLSQEPVDYQEFNRRKSQSLLELSRLVRTLHGEPIKPEAVKRLERLRSKLEVNHSVLEMNLRAVQEVGDIIAGAIQRAESDGTYSAGNFHPSEMR
jgi:hypothetical protein